MQKIKILHIIKSLGRGGAEMLLPETLHLHNKDLFEFHYIYFLPWKDQMVRDIENHGGKVTCMPAGNNFNLFLKVLKVSEYCQEQHIDLIHCHLPWSGFLGRAVHLKTKIPLIYTEHNIQERYHVATRFINRLTFNSQNLVLGVSQDVTNSIQKIIHPKIPVETLLNGVNTEKFERVPEKGKELKEQFSIPEKAVVVGNIAVFRDQKNIPLWVRAFKQISESFPNVYGLLVGAGPEQENIKNLIKELHLEKKIIMPGLQTNTVAYFSAMDIFMMSSSFEGLPVALLEAMSTKCAIVSTKAGGVTEVIRDGVDGLLCEVGDESCLASAAVDLVKNKNRRINFQEIARDRVKESFSLALMVKRLEAIYLKTIQNAH